MFDKRINIFVGHYGSGKSEVAVNCAVKLAQGGNKTAIVDMDIVNPYFRSTDAKSKLEQLGVRVISTLYANTNVDIPALPSEINSILEDKSYRVVLDVGGDDAGAMALGCYQDKIIRDDFELYYVINLFRPMTDTKEKIIEIMREIEQSARIKVTGLINNTNLLNESTANDLIKSQNIIESLMDKTGIPIKLISTMLPSLPEDSRLDYPILNMKKHIYLPF